MIKSHNIKFPYTKWFIDIPHHRDVLFLCAFAILVTWHPLYLQEELNLYELGLYLPGIDAILKGMIPFRDFFHLRGPLELYMPAALMKIFGEHVAVLSTYFYVGTVLTLGLAVLVARELYQTRLFIYLMVPILIARAFPRVVFTYWGGLRYGLGFIAIWFAVKYFKGSKSSWAYGAGFFSVLGLLMSIEIGACILFGVIAAFVFSFFAKTHERSELLKGARAYGLGILTIAAPYCIFLLVSHSFVPYIETVWTVVTRMEKVINLNFISEIPNNPQEAFWAMINPVSQNFKQMTPGYCYVAWVVYLMILFRNKQLTRVDSAVVCLGGYGLLMYNSAFRAIQGSQFEMAMQPEKILYFLLLERIFLLGWEHKKKIFRNLFRIWLAIVIFNTAWYALERYNRRFYVFKYANHVFAGKDTRSLDPLAEYQKETPQLQRLKGMTIPSKQVGEIRAMVEFFNKHTSVGETVFMFPELGSYHFLVDRPFVGRFPMVTFSWFKDQWHEEMFASFKKALPRYAVLDEDLGDWYETVFFRIPKNKAMYDEVRGFVLKNYKPVDKIGSLRIYRLKSAKLRP